LKLQTEQSLWRNISTLSFMIPQSVVILEGIYVAYVQFSCGSLVCRDFSEIEPFPIQFFCHLRTPQLLFILGVKEVGVLRVIILQF
jgi:hypothetical protein